MIEKGKENSKINRLHIVDKFEANYNLVFKLYWPKITNHISEKNGTLGYNHIVNRRIRV